MVRVEQLTKLYEKEFAHVAPHPNEHARQKIEFAEELLAYFGIHLALQSFGNLEVRSANQTFVIDDVELIDEALHFGQPTSHPIHILPNSVTKVRLYMTRIVIKQTVFFVVDIGKLFQMLRH